MELNTIFIIGPQGSGKGTQAKILAERLGFFYWEMGAILREVAKEETELGRQVKDMINHGILLPDELLYKVIESRLSQIPIGKGVVFDGVPRRVGQAEYLTDFLIKQGRKIFTTLFIDLPKEDAEKRLLLRAQIENRPDDTKEIIQQRLKQFYYATWPVVEYLRVRTDFIHIDAKPPIDEVTKTINQALGLN